MVQPTLVASRLTQKPPGLTMPRAGNYPVPQDNESQVDSAAESSARPPRSENELAQGERSIAENPFDSDSSRILFDAIDRLQSCGVNQELAIPQLVIVGGQSSGKSSLLQSLTDIPFPVDTGICTRFATRIVSRRTAAGSENAVKITIVDPEVTNVDVFDYPSNDSYKDYLYTSDRLGIDDFKEIMDEISTKHMGIRTGQGVHAKNFATQVLRIELSGPKRSHFSILDVPGIISYAHDVNQHEAYGVKLMVEEYMRQPANIVICVAAADADLATQGIFQMAADLVDKKRLVGVFTKCDMLVNPTKVIEIASGRGKDSGKSMQDGWFVVRNRSPLDGDDFDIKEAERKLFSQPRWDEIRENRRGSIMLQKYLGNLLCAQIRGNFPAIQESVRRLLSEAEESRKGLGDPRPTHSLRQQYIRSVIERYHTVAVKTLNSPGSFSEAALRVRGLVREANESFTEEMQARGHTHLFEDTSVDPMIQLTKAVSFYSARLAGHPPPPNTTEHGDQEQVTTPPLTPPTKRHAMRKKPTVASQLRTPLVEVIRDQLRIWQTTELPGLVNTDVIKILFRKQSENWQQVAERYIEIVANDIEYASNRILEDVCSHSCSSNLYEKLSRVLSQLQQQAKKKAIRELKEHCRRELESHLQTTDPRFQERLQALRTVRLLEALGSIPSFKSGSFDLAHSKLLFQHFHHSIEGNMINDVHDVVKVYYDLSLEAFIRYVINDIIEDFVSYSGGPLMGLSTDWVFTLSEEEVQKMAREDDETLKKRAHFDRIIEGLKTAHEIAEKARIQTRELGDM
ncbi:vacuolar sorting protein VPS1 [Colletotrichum navitas]|uniref:Vacuolar sorting protein VPS1 n=1 Tax=Colletotrichum navitas TaxID=681940 RepID=A0AAD8Q481_9PEZI|nr:vacuolar sorting protein VPS1 [Colletotrichum navitas]KAK1595545.1 vacuolar sorting protein VPS1 [Colletotrichum navitas]